jgi:hypothetical protein
VVLSGGYFISSAQTQTPFTLASASVASATLANPRPAATRTKSASSAAAAGGVSLAIAADVKAAVDAFASVATSLSRPEALSDAFRGYFAFKAAHADEVKKPYLYFVDYGLPSTAARGYVFDMSTLKLVEGPFTVAHGKGSSTSQYGVPTKFSNASHSNATSLGLYVTKSTYAFTGHSAGQLYHSLGLQIDGVSTGFNDNALARRVVVHGAPYVTPTKAGRSEGCPAMEPTRAERLLPKLADGSVVFLYAPDANWLAGDPWLVASAG